MLIVANGQLVDRKYQSFTQSTYICHSLCWVRMMTRKNELFFTIVNKKKRINSRKPKFAVNVQVSVKQVTAFLPILMYTNIYVWFGFVSVAIFMVAFRLKHCFVLAWCVCVCLCICIFSVSYTFRVFIRKRNSRAIKSTMKQCNTLSVALCLFGTFKHSNTYIFGDKSMVSHRIIHGIWTVHSNFTQILH